MPNHAAFKKADVDDARRGSPAVDLSDYAQARGLEPLGQALVGHFGGLNPLWKDYAFNVLRGEVVPGRFGTIQHELQEESLGDDGEPSYMQRGKVHGFRARTNMTWRSFLPLGELFEKEAPNKPFAAQAFWIPTTSVKLLLPEAALLPRILITRMGFRTIREHHLVPGFALNNTDSIGDDLSAALAQALGPTLAQLKDGTTYAQLQIKHGALGLRVDGFRSDPAELDALAQFAGAFAEAIARLAEVTHEHPAPAFAEPLPPFDPTTHPAGYSSFASKFDNSGVVALERDAAALGLRIEDPAALHRAYAHLPIPGTSRGLLAGTLPGSQAFGRLTWNTQGHPGSSTYLRRGAIVAARPGAAPTPLGGTLIASTDMYVEVADGLACCWTRTNSLGKLDTAELAERAVATFRESGTADV